MFFHIVEQPVSAESTDQEIIAAIREASVSTVPEERGDTPDPDDPNQNAWVLPKDIGESTAKDPSLLNRLKDMVDKGLLEIHLFGNRPRFRIRTK